MLIPNRAMPLFKMFTCFRRLFTYRYDSAPWKCSLYLVILLYGDWLFELSLLHSPGCFQPAGRNSASYSEKSQEYAAAFWHWAQVFSVVVRPTLAGGWVWEPTHCPPHIGKFSSLKSPQWNVTSKAPTGTFNWQSGFPETKKWVLPLTKTQKCRSGFGKRVEEFKGVWPWLGVAARAPRRWGVWQRTAMWLWWHGSWQTGPFKKFKRKWGLCWGKVKGEGFQQISGRKLSTVTTAV